MQNKTLMGYDDTKKMLNKLRKLNESKTSNSVIKEQMEMSQQEVEPEQTQKQESDFIIINDVEVKMLSTDNMDMELKDDQKETISNLIDNFKQQVSQIVDFDPGMTINQKQIRLDGTLTDEDISFVFIAGDDSGVYINADMLKLDTETGTMLEKLSKFEETFKTSMEPLIDQRNNN
jgi:hypothetical protein